jgi:hypothetical protein
MNTIAHYGFIVIAVLGLSYTSASVKAADLTNKIPEAVRTALENAERFELLSLNPNAQPNQRPNEQFHGWRILGSTVVKDAETRNDLVTALKKGVEENKGMAANCFNPRHGIRVSRDGNTNDLVICFECLQVLVYQNDKGEKPAGFLISDSTQSAESLFNRALMKQKIPLADR